MRLRKFWSDQRGNAAIIFGLAAVPLIALGGGIVDFAHRAKVRGELQSAADTAAIAAARVLQLGQLNRNGDQEATEAEAIAAATRLLDAALAHFGGSAAAGFTVSIAGEVISISAEIDVDTSFLGVIGINELKAKASAEVNLPDPILVEVALVLDYSGSMRDADKYIRMTTAAQSFIAKVEENRGNTSKIGIVPFSEYVHATLPGGVLRGTAAEDNNTPMTTCLLNRDHPYATTDGTPSTSIEGSRWPYVELSDPKCQGYADGGLAVHDLTDDFSALSEALASMEPMGLTNISLAAEMGWQLLSPNRPFETARDYSDDKVQKILILLTDGKQTVSAMGPSGDVSREAADETTAELCANAKDAGLRIFSVAYDVTDPEVHDLLLGCATSNGSYFDASVSEISAVFDEIYSQIAESVWLSR